MNKTSISVLVPAYNEELLIRETITELVQYLRTLSLDSFEVIICVNGSSDSTEQISKQLSEELEKVKYFSTKERGFGFALNEGIKKANKEMITFIPGDGEIVLDFKGESIKLMENYDFISGSRYIDEKSSGSNKLRKFLGWVFASSFRILFDSGLTEVGTVKVFKTKWAKTVLEKLTEKNYAWQIQAIYNALHDGLRVTETPVKARIKRDPSHSKVRIFSDGISMLVVCLKYGLKFRLHI